jgi:hypothetical protein
MIFAENDPRLRGTLHRERPPKGRYTSYWYLHYRVQGKHKKMYIKLEDIKDVKKQLQKAKRKTKYSKGGSEIGESSFERLLRELREAQLRSEDSDATK